MAGSGTPKPNRLVTFIEVNFSPNWILHDLSDDGFINWEFSEDSGQDVGSISITRSDGKVLSFNVTDHSFGVQTRENVIRWTSSPEYVGSDGSFQ